MVIRLPIPLELHVIWFEIIDGVFRVITSIVCFYEVKYGLMDEYLYDIFLEWQLITGLKVQ